jgi:hypothetical protein
MSFRILSERGQSLARSNITSIRRLASAANTAASKKQFPEPLFPSGLHKRSELIGEVAKGKNVQSSTTTKKPTLFPNIEKKSKDDKTKSHKEDMSTAPIEQRNIDSGNPVSNRPPKDQASGASPSLNDSLTWSEFFRLRRRLQLIQRFGGIPFTFAFWAVEGVILSLPIFDPTKTIMQLDPMVIVGLVTVAGSVASYAIGVSLTGLAWRMIRSNLAKQLDNVFLSWSMI